MCQAFLPQDCFFEISFYHSSAQFKNEKNWWSQLRFIRNSMLFSPHQRPETPLSTHFTSPRIVWRIASCTVYSKYIYICTKMIISFVIDSVGIASILHLVCSSVVPKYFSLLETWLFFSWLLKNTYCCNNMYVKIKNCQPTLFCRQDVLLIFFINSFGICIIDLILRL